MTTEIKFENKNTSVIFGNLQVGDKFMLTAQVGKQKDAVYIKLPDLYAKERDLYLKNAVNISTGIPIEVLGSNFVIPVDLGITAYK